MDRFSAGFEGKTRGNGGQKGVPERAVSALGAGLAGWLARSVKHDIFFLFLRDNEVSRYLSATTADKVRLDTMRSRAT